MVARNEITGDEIRSKGVSQAYRDNAAKIFGNSRPQRGSYRQCRETGKMLPIREWLEKYAEPEKPRTPMVICKNFDAYESPARPGVIIRNERERREDMKVSGCREYEGLAQEKKEAERYQKYQDEKLEQVIEQTVDQTAYEIENGYRTPSSDGKLTFDLGE